MTDKMLKNARIWLSGSIPKNASGEEAERIRQFVRTFAAESFRRGGIIVHGSHPSIRDVLLEVAKKYNDTVPGRRAGLILAVSQHFAKEAEKHGIDIDGWNAICGERVIVTREVPPEPDANRPDGMIENRDYRAPSLTHLRNTILGQCNAIVALGGKWWETATYQAGVPEEVELAMAEGLPLFLLGACGGSLRGYLNEHPEVLRQCQNGLTEEQNGELANETEPGRLAQRICETLERLPLNQSRPRKALPFRILCLDGGGICGVFTAAVLRRWEERTKCRIVDHFDMIAGTSTGGLLAIGLGLGMSPAALEEFYKAEGPNIFPTDSGIRSLSHSIRHWFASKFDSNRLKSAIEQAYGDAPIKPPNDKYLTRILIPYYNSSDDSPRLFRAWPESPVVIDRRFDPVDAALATSAAPTYFQPHQMNHVRAIDGGVWAICPSLVAIAAAVRELKIDMDRIHLLSIGTTYDTNLLASPAQIDGQLIKFLVKPAAGKFAAWLASVLWKPLPVDGKLGWIPNIAGLLMKTQRQKAEHVCDGILGSDRFLRVDEPTIETKLDDVDAIHRLISLGETAAEKELVKVKYRFLNGEPIHKPWLNVRQASTQQVAGTP